MLLYNRSNLDHPVLTPSQLVLDVHPVLHLLLVLVVLVLVVVVVVELARLGGQLGPGLDELSQVLKVSVP